jgi:hypothetical protein
VGNTCKHGWKNIRTRIFFAKALANVGAFVVLRSARLVALQLYFVAFGNIVL